MLPNIDAKCPVHRWVCDLQYDVGIEAAYSNCDRVRAADPSRVLERPSALRHCRLGRREGDGVAVRGAADRYVGRQETDLSTSNDNGKAYDDRRG